MRKAILFTSEEMNNLLKDNEQFKKITADFFNGKDFQLRTANSFTSIEKNSFVLCSNDVIEIDSSNE